MLEDLGRMLPDYDDDDDDDNTDRDEESNTETECESARRRWYGEVIISPHPNEVLSAVIDASERRG